MAHTLAHELLLRINWLRLTPVYIMKAIVIIATKIILQEIKQK